MGKRFKPRPVYLIDDSSFERHGATILLLVREGTVHDWESLCSAFNFNPRAYHSGHYSLKRTLEDLIEADLLFSEDGITGPYQITDILYNVQHALGISLIQAANLTYLESIAARPIFGKPLTLDKAPHIFVLMPFEKPLRPTYNSIKNVCRDLKISVERADDIFSASTVVSDIWTAICNSGVIIADCTNKNPNVFYEIGIAHTIGKIVVLISQQDDHVPFDVKYIRYIRYSSSASGLRKLERDLRRTITEVGKGIWDA